MFVGEAPGFHEDQQGVPFVGQAGQLLERLLERDRPLPHGRLYRERAQVPPAREPGPSARGDRGLRVASVPPDRVDQADVVATLGNFATKLLSGKPTGITRVHGVPQQVTLGGNAVTLYPIYHPAAALYTRAMLSVLEEDFARIPQLLGRPAAAPAAPEPFVPEPVFERAPEPAVQLGLF